MAIQTKRVSELSAQQKSLFERAKKAISQRNYSYAFEMLRTLLRSVPGCVEARLALRVAQLDRFGGAIPGMAKLTGRIKSIVPVFIKGPMQLKRGKLVDALDTAEKGMESDPSFPPAIFLLVRCADAAGWPLVGINALEMGTRLNPKNIPLLTKLADFYERVGDTSKALQTRQQLCALRPDDLALENSLKQASAMAAMDRGKWEEADSFRDIIKDKEQAKTLEQRERLAARDEDTLRDLIQDAEQAVAEQPTAASHKRLADLYRQAKEFDQALEQYNQVVELSGALDPAIDTAMTDVLIARFDDAIEQWRTYAAEDESRQAEADERIAEIEQQKDETILQRYRDRVKRYPNDATYRFQLGELFFQKDQFDDALKEFQVAQRNPQLRRRALTYMGKCMAKKGLTDMAIDQLKAALGEGGSMNKERKDITYNLALLYEESGRDEEALSQLKEIYAVDVNYLDVSDRIEAFYKKAKEE